MPATSSFDKGAVVEEWADRRFFRPVGLRIARILAPTPITADQVTLLCLVLGLAAGRLCFYPDLRRNVAGVILFVISDIFDSVDGQLARMRGTSTRLGRVLDGMADTLRFVNLYLQLMARAVFAGGSWWLVVPVGFAAGIAHSLQSSVADFIRQAYLHLGEGAGELDLPEDYEDPGSTRGFARIRFILYRRYLARQERLFPDTIALARELRATGMTPELSAACAREQGPLVRQCAWIGQNIRFLLLALLVVPGWPVAFFWVTLVPLSLVAHLLVSRQEHVAAQRLAIVAPELAPAA